jgi:endoglucanase
MGKAFTGSDADKAKVRRDYERKIGFSKKTNSPIWNGMYFIPVLFYSVDACLIL